MTQADLEGLIAEHESSVLEFKATTGQRSDACKSLTGTLNGSGGHVCIVRSYTQRRSCGTGSVG